MHVVCFNSHQLIHLQVPTCTCTFVPNVCFYSYYHSLRSTTEKLLAEMFPGRAAQFLAITESLTDLSHRPLQQNPPSPITDMDQDTVGDVSQVCL